MKSSLHRLTLVGSVLLTVIGIDVASAQGLNGATWALQGTQEQYQYYDDVMLTNPSWSISNGSIVSVWQSGTVYYCTVLWHTVGNQTISFFDGAFMYGQLEVSVEACPVSTPATTFAYTSNSTQAIITRNANPQSGVTWYWQTSPSGTSMALGSSNSFNSASAGSTYYLRAYHNSYACWSTGSLATAIVPGNASASPVSRCGPGTVILSASHGANGDAVRWYNVASGGSVLATGDYNTTISETTTFYACSYNTSTGAHGVRIPVTATMLVSVGGQLTNANEDLNEFKGTLTVTNHTGNVSWEVNTGSGWSSLTVTGASLYYNQPNYTSAQYRAVVQVADCQVAYSTILKIERAPIAYSNTVQLTALSGGSWQWYKNGTLISGATGQNYPVSEPAVYTVKNGSTTTGVFFVPNTLTLPGQAYPVNAVRTIKILKPGVTASTNLYTLLPTEIAQVISYQDGIGRTFQTVAVNQAPTSKDIVAVTGPGRQGLIDTTFLPYVSSANNGLFRPNAIRGSNNTYTASEQYQFYQGTPKVAVDNYPFARTLYRNTPDAKVIEQGAPGADWQPGSNQTVRNVTTWNNQTTYRVRYWKADGTTHSNYPDNSVAVSIITDENNNKVRTFTNALGQTVLKQVQIDETLEGVSTAWLETYYIYDELGRIKYIVPPKAMKVLGTGATLNANNSSVNELIYKYTYDGKGRLQVKKEPGAAEQHFVYDNHDRLVFTQDGNLRSQNRWSFVKFDKYNRSVYTGVYNRNVTRATLQSEMDARNYDTEPYYEVEQDNATYHGYSNQVYPTTDLTLLAVSYYDHYDFDRNGIPDYNYDNTHLTGQESTASTSTRGMATGGKRVTINEAGNVTATWLINVVFYDQYDRPIQTLSNNHLYTTVADKGTVIYDFAGKVLKTKTTHYQNATTSVTLTDWNDYDHAGRTLKTYRQINNETPVTVAQYEYNALGQLVDKKLHVDGSGSFLQSVDFRYTIRGWLKSINNAQLTNDPITNDDTGDYFGIELIYNQAESGLNNTKYYNGNISAIKWKGPAQANGAEDQRSYKYTYDKSDRLKTATFQAHSGSAWNKEVNTLNESLTYDHNGNIKTLLRNQNQRGLSGTTVTSTPQTIDNLTYTYASNYNRLTKVEDATGNTAGFKNGTNVTTEYTYNNSGSLTSDLNKGIATNGISYNMLGKPRVVNFTDGRKVEYVYDASGAKLTMKTWQGTTLLTTTNYSGGFVYEGATPALSFFSSPEGRIVMKGSNFEYEYAIADHQGNTRVVFTSATPTPVSKTATFEGDANDNSNEFTNVSNVVASAAANHTPGGSKVVRMNQNYRIGPSKSLKVYPGDVVNTEVWAYYESGSGYGTTSPALAVVMNAVAAAFGGVSGGGGESGAIFNGVDNAYGAFGLAGNQGDNVPAAYLNYILFDQHYNVLNMGWRPVTTASSWNKAKVSFDPINIKEAGYIFVYLSYENESNNWVYFDDFKVTHAKSNIIQYNEYYPFGMTTQNSWTREGATGNNFLGNGGTEWNATSSFYDLDYRNYDPILGRMNGVDPMASKYASLTPYNFSFNDPVTFTDPSGADPNGYYEGAEPIFEQYTSWMYNPGYGWMQDDHIYNRIIGWRGPVARYAGPGLDWMFKGAGTGPASGGHWAVGMRSAAENFALMSSSAFAGLYGIGSGMSDADRFNLALGLSQSPNQSELAYAGRALGLGNGESYNGSAYFTTVLSPAMYDSRGNRLADQVNGVINIALGVGRKDLIGAFNQRQGIKNSYSGISGELSGRLTFGAQASMVFLPEPTIVPYIRGAIGLDINLGSLILWEGKGSTSNGVSTKTFKDKAFVQSIGLATVFGGFEMERIAMPHGIGDSWSVTSSTTLGLLAIQLNSDGNLSIGMLPKAKFAAGFGAEIMYQFNFINFKLW